MAGYHKLKRRPNKKVSIDRKDLDFLLSMCREHDRCSFIETTPASLELTCIRSKYTKTS